LACAAAGAEVVHVDASKGMVQWARENAALSGLADRPTRWLVDDCKKFVERELRRGSTYDGIIMDPPSYGRGPGGEVWKLEDSIYELVGLTAGLLSKKPLFYLLNSYTTGLSAPVMQYLLQVCILPQHGGTVLGDDIGLPVSQTGGVFPCGSTAICAWQ
jgi:Predicted SAM-dependent methyltransferases